jgi:transposase
LQRINVLYHVEAMIRGLAPEQRQAVRHEHSRPVVDDLRAWLDVQLAKVPRRARIAEAIRYALKLWSGLRLFLDDGRIEIDTNVVERASVRSPSTARTRSSPAPTRAASTGASSPR